MIDGFSLPNNNYSDNSSQGNNNSQYGGLPDPNMLNIYFQQSFSKMFSDLISSKKDDSSDSSSFDPFASMSNLTGNGINGLFQNTASTSSTDTTYLQKLYEISSYSSLIGKDVTYKSPFGGAEGNVERVVIDAGKPYLVIGTDKVVIADIVSVA